MSRGIIAFFVTVILGVIGMFLDAIIGFDGSLGLIFAIASMGAFIITTIEDKSSK